MKKNTVFIDVFHKMLKADGMPMDNIFLEDKLHMNSKGYAIWQKEKDTLQNQLIQTILPSKNIHGQEVN